MASLYLKNSFRNKLASLTHWGRVPNWCFCSTFHFTLAPPVSLPFLLLAPLSSTMLSQSPDIEWTPAFLIRLVYNVRLNPLVSAGRRCLFASACVRKQFWFHSYSHSLLPSGVLPTCPCPPSTGDGSRLINDFLYNVVYFPRVSGRYLKRIHLLWKAHSVPQSRRVSAVSGNLISSI